VFCQHLGLFAVMHLCQKHTEIICVLLDCHSGIGDEVTVVEMVVTYAVYPYTVVFFLTSDCTKSQGLHHIYSFDACGAMHVYILDKW